MNREEIFELMNNNLAFYLGTVEEGEPRVRGMMLYKADETGIVFHTGAFKDVYKQILSNPHAQLCFIDPVKNIQVRVRGTLEIVDDPALKDEISNHPTRGFVKAWRESGPLEDFYNSFIVLRMKSGFANVWTFDKNFAPKEDIAL